jgi:hypothetical protein
MAKESNYPFQVMAKDSGRRLDGSYSIKHNKKAKAALPDVLHDAIIQADYLPSYLPGNPKAVNPISGRSTTLTPLAYKVYKIAMYSNDMLWQLNELSKLPDFPRTGEDRVRFQAIWDTNHEVFYSAVGWMQEFYIHEYMTLLD